MGWGPCLHLNILQGIYIHWTVIFLATSGKYSWVVLSWYSEKCSLQDPNILQRIYTLALSYFWWSVTYIHDIGSNYLYPNILRCSLNLREIIPFPESGIPRSSRWSWLMFPQSSIILIFSYKKYFWYKTTSHQDIHDLNSEWICEMLQKCSRYFCFYHSKCSDMANVLIFSVASNWGTFLSSGKILVRESSWGEEWYSPPI